MKRREFITLLGSVAAWPIAARAQQPDRMRLIGVLIAYAQNDSTAQSWLAAFRAALATLGWTEGSNLRMELRSGITMRPPPGSRACAATTPSISSLP
jgi:putative ABC transport system substrate-binding protein